MAENYSKEEQKRILRERTLSTDDLRSNLAYVRQERERKKKRNTVIVLSFLGLAVICTLVYLWARFYQFTTYDVEGELKIGGLAGSELYSFQDGCIVIGPDALTYVKNDKVVWTGSVKLSDALFSSEGGYFAVCDRGGYQAYVCDGSGIISTVKVSRHIRKIDIASDGVLCVFTEADDAAYISFFDRFGTKTQAEVKALLSATGYPMDIAVSPDGKKLITLYYSTENGIGESRLVYYDFEHGKSNDNYISASFGDYYDSDTLLVDADFISDSESYVIGDHSITFLANEKKEIARTVAEIEDPILSVFRATDRLGIVTVSDGKTQCTLYDRKGKAGKTFEVPDLFDRILADDRQVFFFTGNKVRIYNMTGESRYEGELSDNILAVCMAGHRTLIVNTGAELMRITYK
ncbi:MAG: hypothetical protein IJL43_05840 [Lachnospiraceae bacterium]|nr:hypothetical protein [Lachnospiraceae bacterium]